MAMIGPRFCPRCGTARVGDMTFCPKCGLDLTQLSGDEPQRAIGEPPASSDETRETPPPARAYEPPRKSSGLGRLLVPGLVVLALLLAAGWIGGLGPFARSGSPGNGSTASPTAPLFAPVTAPPSSFAPGITASPSGLTILSPTEGAVVGTADLTVIGSAPPGLKVTQDISLGFDRHTTSDGTGHWAIQVPLSAGQNELRFRIGDDPSTTQSIHVTYVPPPAP